MKKTYIIPILFLLFISIKSNAQEQDPRWQLTQPIEAEIEVFINDNIDRFKLSERELNTIRKDHTHEYLSQNEIDNKILSIKKNKLRGLYFKENPKSREAYQPLNATAESRQICNDGNFEGANPLANYTFSNYAETQPLFDACNMALQNGTPLPISNLIDNFTADYTLVSQGSDPDLLANFGVNLPRTFNGTSQAIKLNRSVGDFLDGGRDVTHMRRNFTVNENNLSINFSLILENPNHITNLPGGGTKDEQPFFRVRLFDVAGNIVYERCIVSDPNNCIFTGAGNNNQTLFSGWQCLNINTQNLINQQVTLELSIVDCGLNGHYGTVYIDEICNTACNSSAFGDIILNPVNQNCPTNPFQVCGSYASPLCSVGNPTFSLDILDQAGNIINTLNNPTINQFNNTFCFNVNPNNFGVNPTSTFEFEVFGNFLTNTGFLNTINDLSANVGPDVDFANCPCPGLIPNINIINNTIGCPINFIGSNIGVSCGGETYFWEVFNDLNNDGPDTSDIVYTTTNSSFNETDYSFTNTPGNYSVSLTVTDASGTVTQTINSTVIIQDECYYNCSSDWLKSIGTLGGSTYKDEFASNVVVDNEDNIIVLGYSNENTTIEGVLIPGRTYLNKYAPNGCLIWAKDISHLKVPHNMLINGNNELILLTKDHFESGSNLGNLYYLSKYNTDGQEQWRNIIKFGRATNLGSIVDMDINKTTNDVFLTINATQTITVIDQTSIQQDIQNGAPNNLHAKASIVQFNSNGFQTWTETLYMEASVPSGAVSLFNIAISDDTNEIFITGNGRREETISFLNSTNSFTLPSNNSVHPNSPISTFILKINTLSYGMAFNAYPDWSIDMSVLEYNENLDSLFAVFYNVTNPIDNDWVIVIDNNLNITNTFNIAPTHAYSKFKSHGDYVYATGQFQSYSPLLIAKFNETSYTDNIVTTGSYSQGNYGNDLVLNDDKIYVVGHFKNGDFHVNNETISHIGNVDGFITSVFDVISCADYAPITLTAPTDNVTTGDTINYLNHNTITASNIIEYGASSTYRATTSISLLPGFHAQNGSNFNAYIEECVDPGLRTSKVETKKIETEDITKLNDNFKVYPNPITNELNITINKTKINSYALFNIQGQLVKSENEMNTNKHTINTQDVSQGIYLLKTTLKSGEIIINKIIKN